MTGRASGRVADTQVAAAVLRQVALRPPRPPEVPGRYAWLQVRLLDVADAWQSAGYPLTLAGVTMNWTTARSLGLHRSGGGSGLPTVAGLRVFVLPEASVPLDVFDVRPGVVAAWPSDVSCVASVPVRGYLYDEPVPAAVVETRWVLEREGMPADAARRAAAALLG